MYAVVKFKATRGPKTETTGLDKVEAIKQANALHEIQKAVPRGHSEFLSGVAFLVVQEADLASLEFDPPRTSDSRITHQAGNW